MPLVTVLWLVGLDIIRTIFPTFSHSPRLLLNQAASSPEQGHVCCVHRAGLRRNGAEAVRGGHSGQSKSQVREVKCRFDTISISDAADRASQVSICGSTFRVRICGLARSLMLPRQNIAGYEEPLPTPAKSNSNPQFASDPNLKSCSNPRPPPTGSGGPGMCPHLQVFLVAPHWPGRGEAFKGHSCPWDSRGLNLGKERLVLLNRI